MPPRGSASPRSGRPLWYTPQTIPLRRLWLASFCSLPLFAQNRLIRLSDDGGWCWFQDPRVIVAGGKLIAGVVSSGWRDARRRGNVEAVTLDLETGVTGRFPLFRSEDPAVKERWLDDHNSPAFAVLPDGRLLAAFTRHHEDGRIHVTTSRRPADPSAWEEVRAFTPGRNSLVTYSNLHPLRREGGRIYNFFRGLDNSFKPSYTYSDDAGRTWLPGSVLINVPGKPAHRPYVKYASDGHDTIHLAYTEAHPGDFDTSIYHVYYRGGNLYRSDGTLIRSLAAGLRTPAEGTLVFRGDARNVAWISDLRLDASGRPYLAFSVQKDSPGLPPGQGGEDHRYHYAAWDGGRWRNAEVAFAGSRLYAGEDDYTGLPCLDPHDPGMMFISTNAHPVTGEPLVSAADGRRHWEIWGGRRNAAGRWEWQPVTRDSSADNIRPVMPVWPGGRFAVLWLRGTMRSYKDYRLEVVGMVGDRKGQAPAAPPWQAAGSAPPVRGAERKRYRSALRNRSAV